MFTPKNDSTNGQQLKVQRLVIRSDDPSMYTNNSGSSSVCILIREPVDQIYLVSFKDDSANTLTQYAQASLSVVDTDTLTSAAPSDRGAIRISGLATLDTNDCVIVEYTVLLQHLS